MLKISELDLSVKPRKIFHHSYKKVYPRLKVPKGDGDGVRWGAGVISVRVFNFPEDTRFF